jgi:hypothetical protein
LLAVACGSKRELKREEKKLKEYLKAKYNDEFVINKLDYYIPQIGSLMIKGTASPKDNKDIIFQIVSSSLDTDSSDKFGDDYRENGHYDDYLGYYWQDSAEKIYEIYCDEIWGNQIESINIMPHGGKDLDENFYFEYLPNFDQALLDYPEKISIEISVEIKCENFDLNGEAVKVLDFIDKVRVPKFYYYRLTFNYYEDNREDAITVWKTDIDEIETVGDVINEYYTE